MRLSPYILDLFFGSDEGARLVQGFEELAAVWTKHDATRGGNVDAPSPAAMAGAGSASDIPQDDRRSSSNDEDDRRELAWEARSAIPDCFDAVAECMRRTLLELGGERPSSRDGADLIVTRGSGEFSAI